jgi:hypothetical protein
MKTRHSNQDNSSSDEESKPKNKKMKSAESRKRLRKLKDIEDAQEERNEEVENKEPEEEEFEADEEEKSEADDGADEEEEEEEEEEKEEPPYRLDSDYESGEDDDYDPNEDNFVVDDDELIDTIIKICPKLTKPEATEVAGAILSKVVLNTMFGGKDPNIRKNWDKELDEATSARLKQKLEEYQKKIEAKMPTLPQILDSNLSDSKKERLLELYEIWVRTDPHSMEFLEMKGILRAALKKARDEPIIPPEKKAEIKQKKL